jgi:hypothetical protein
MPYVCDTSLGIHVVEGGRRASYRASATGFDNDFRDFTSQHTSTVAGMHRSAIEKHYKYDMYENTMCF